MTNFTDKAKKLVGKKIGILTTAAALGSISATGAQAGIIDSNDINLNSSTSGFWAQSGALTHAFSGAASGQERTEVLGNGLKLYGAGSMSGGEADYDPLGKQGIAFWWAGSVNDILNPGDVLSLDYEFDINVQSDHSVSWQISAELLPNEVVARTGRFTPGTDASGRSDAWGRAYNGDNAFTGTATSSVGDVTSEGEYYWSIVLAAHWNGAWASTLNSSDLFSITIPDRSIDVGINVVPTQDHDPVAVAEPHTAALLGLGLLGLGLARRKMSEV